MISKYRVNEVVINFAECIFKVKKGNHERGLLYSCLVNNISHLSGIFQCSRYMRSKSFLNVALDKIIGNQEGDAEFRMQEVNTLSGIVSRVIGRIFEGELVSSFLCIRIVHAFFHSSGIVPESQTARNNSVR